jgi:hypothetical protein
MFANSRFFRAEDGGSMFLRNFGIYLQVHTALQSRTPTSIGAGLLSTSLLRKIDVR